MRYRIKLLTDKEILNGATIKYQAADLTDPDHRLDSTLFGSSITKSTRCQICNQTQDKCPSHYAVIELPMPVIKSICYEECLKLIPCICPCCSKLILTDETLDRVKKLDAPLRMSTVSDLCSKIDMSTFSCPHCDTRLSSTIMLGDWKYNFVPIFQIKNPSTAEFETVNPIDIQRVLQGFTQIDEIGFKETFHPKNFMTCLLPIIPTKLRSKSIVNGNETASAITTFYRLIIETTMPKLTTIKNYSLDNSFVLIHKSMVDEFKQYYTMLQTYYMLITYSGSEETTNQLLSILNKSSQSGFDPHNCLINRFKGKTKSIFNKGMCGMVHPVSGRVVLGAGEDAPIENFLIPYKIANQLVTTYPVYQENLRFYKRCIAISVNKTIMSDQRIPHVIGVISQRTSTFKKLTPANAKGLEMMLEAGDKIAFSLFDKDFIIQSRHPCIREASLTSFEVEKADRLSPGMPVMTTGPKQADFDGDEIQLFMCSGHYTDIESLLLHSATNQLMSYDNPKLDYFFLGDHEDWLGSSRLGDIEINYMNHQKCAPTNILRRIESAIPKDFNYTSSQFIVRNGKIDSNVHNFRSHEFYKFFAAVYGNVACARLLDVIEQSCYDINRCLGATLGFEIYFHGTPEQKAKINEMMRNAYQKASELIRVNGTSNHDVIACFDEPMSTIQKILFETSINTNMGRLEYTKNRLKEYYAMIVRPTHSTSDGLPFSPSLADGTRTTFGGYRWSMDPCEYGYPNAAYVDDMNSYSHFFIVSEELGSIFKRCEGTAKQGYLSNRLTNLFERAYTDYNGCLVDGNTLLSHQYGPMGLNPRREVQLKLGLDDDIKLGPKGEALRKELQSIREQYRGTTSFVSQPTKDIFISGVDFDQLFTEKGSTPEKEIDQLIDQLRRSYVPDAIKDDVTKLDIGLKQHEFYFRRKLAEYKLTPKLSEEIVNHFLNMLVEAGDPVGTKSSLAASAPLTQASLSAIHAASSGGANVDVVRRAFGLKAFEELLGGAKCRSDDDEYGDDYLHIYLINDDHDSCASFANEQETFYFKDIWVSNEIHISKTIPDEYVKMYGHQIRDQRRSPYYVKSVWNMIRISQNDIKVTDIIKALMKKNDDILMMLPRVINQGQVEVNIYFIEDIGLQKVNSIARQWHNCTNDTIISGGLLKNCYVAENKNNPGHYIIEANDITKNNDALRWIILDPRVDPTRCKTTEPILDSTIAGIFEGEARHYDRLCFTATNMSDTSSCCQRVYRVCTAVQTATGRLTFATSKSMMKEMRGDMLKCIRFESAPDMIRRYGKYADWQTSNEFTVGSVFNTMPGLGSGVSQYIIQSV